MKPIERYARLRADHVFGTGVLNVEWLVYRYPALFWLYESAYKHYTAVEVVSKPEQTVFYSHGTELRGTRFFMRHLSVSVRDNVYVDFDDEHIFSIVGKDTPELCLRSVDGRLYESDGLLVELAGGHSLENIGEPVKWFDMGTTMALPFHPFKEAHAVRFVHPKVAAVVGTGYAAVVTKGQKSWPVLVPPEFTDLFINVQPVSFWVGYVYRVGIRGAVTSPTGNGWYPTFKGTPAFTQAKNYSELLFHINRLVYPRLSRHQNIEKFFTDLAVKALA